VNIFRAAVPAVLAAAALYATAPAPVAAAPLVCPQHAAAAPALTRLRAALAHGRFVTYQPTSLKVVDGRITPANPADVRADLAVLRKRFDGLITYDAVHGAQAIPAIADALKFRALIIGVWNPFDEAEVAAAIEAAHAFPRLVLGVSLGNEMLFSHRSDAARLAGLVTRVRAQLPHVPLSTTEPFHLYYEPATADLRSRLDFLLANVHPVFQPWFREAPDSNAAEFVVNVVEKLATQSCGPIIVKETGVPTDPASAGFSEGRQAGFYRELRRVFPPGAGRAFAYFAAFDAPWRAYDATGVPGVHPEEAHWGLYDTERHPKPAATELSALPGG
jgi:exo-beta-1,3-glucanase (GH17 family)